MRLFLLILTSIISISVFAQTPKILDIPFQNKNGEAYINAQVGGLHAPQFNAIDLDGDGRKDLLIFDRTGNVLLPFINDGSTDGNNYHFDLKYIKYFPDNLVDFISVHDFNDDGIEDIFSTSVEIGIPGISVFKGTRDADGYLHFTVEKSLLKYPSHSNGFFTNIPLLNIDYPAIADVDFDGDIDILTFGIGGGTVEYYRNYSVERNYGKDSLVFELEERCWGGFYESGLSNTIELSDTKGECAEGFAPSNSGSRHAGSAITVIDMDNDMDYELAVGDVSFPSINMLFNGGDKDDAWMTEQISNFPDNTRDVDIDIFPSAFFMDVNNDDKIDFIAANCTSIILENYNCAWMYKNIGSTENPVFEYVKGNFIVDQMIDLGSVNHPVFVDVNNDGLDDLVCGTNGKYDPNQKNNRLVYFQNIGTLKNPKFKLIDEDWLSFSEQASEDTHYSPTFGDIDGDGDLDLLIGVYNGSMYFAENTAQENQPMKFTTFIKNYMDIDVGLLANPTVVDLNRDGLMDIVIGERNSNLNYFQNQGSTSNPMFEADQNVAPNTSLLGNVLVKEPGVSNSTNSPVFIEVDGKYQLICGSQKIGVHHFDNIEGNLYGEFNRVSDHFANHNFGDALNPTLADINHDGKYDLMIGNNRGGFSTITTNFTSPFTATDDIQTNIQFDIYPNPTTTQIWVNFDNSTLSNANITIFDCLGNKVLVNRNIESTSAIDVSSISNGTYFLKLEHDGRFSVKKMIVLRK